MNSAGAKKLVATAEEKTGYKVVVDTIEGINSDAQMISARPELPVHSIRVNKAKLVFADYIVAIQSAMLLRIWSDPARIPVFTPIPQKVAYFAEKAASSKPLSDLGSRLASETAARFANGLLEQARSGPAEIVAIRDVHNVCPDLRDMQTEAVEYQLRLTACASRQTFCP